MSVDLQLPNPFDKDRPYVRPPGITSREWTRLAVMAVLFFIALGVMVVLHFMRREPAKPRAAPVQKKEASEPEPERKEGPPAAQNLEEKAAETLRTLRDGPEPIRKDQPEFLDFLYLMLKKDREEAARQVDPATGPKEILADPKAARGKYVRMRGRLIQLYTEPLPVTTTTGTRDVFYGVMQTYPSNLTVTFYLAEKPVAPDGKEMRFRTKQYQGESLIEDWVEIEGMFLRIYEYEGQPDSSGKTPKIRAPLVFARTIRPSAPPKLSNPRKDFLYLVAGVAVVVIGIILVAGIVTRKYDRRTLRMSMVAARQEKARAEGKPLFPEPKPILGPEVPPEPPKE